MHTAPEWRVLGHSVRGAAHFRSGLPNQDAIHWLPATRTGPPLILTVSDGHGSAKNFRSDVGSDLAVRQTAWLIQDLLDGQPDPANLSAIKRTAEERLPQEIVRQWQEAVASYHRKTPFTSAELRALEEEKGLEARRKVEATPRLAYGATILCVLVTTDFILYLQLGDGDILTVSEAGEVQRPLRKDARLFANETTSLCTEDAWRDVRFRFQTIFGAPPALIMLATDGYANSFVNDTAFFKVGSDLLAILREEGRRPSRPICRRGSARRRRRAAATTSRWACSTARISRPRPRPRSMKLLMRPKRLALNRRKRRSKKRPPHPRLLHHPNLNQQRQKRPRRPLNPQPRATPKSTKR